VWIERIQNKRQGGGGTRRGKGPISKRLGSLLLKAEKKHEKASEGGTGKTKYSPSNLTPARDGPERAAR